MASEQRALAGPDGAATIELPSYQERIWFLGVNGSGKTILESEMLRPYPRVVVLDIKYDFPIPWEKGEYVVLHKPPGGGWFLPGLLDPWRAHDRIVYRPVPPYDTGRAITGFLDAMFARGRREGKRRPFILAIDEGTWASYAGAKMAMARLSVSGRSLGIGLWIASQRPRGIPVEVRSEAWRVYVFWLQREEDRKELVQTLNDEAIQEMFRSTPDEYGFWEIRRMKGGRLEYRYMPPIKYHTPVEKQ